MKTISNDMALDTWGDLSFRANHTGRFSDLWQ